MNGPHMTFFGRLTRDPELRYSPNEGIPFVTAGVAVNTYHGPGADQETLFVDVTLWRHHAENAAARCRKGHLVYVQGRYSSREYERRDGSTGTSHEVTAKEFRHLPQGSPEGSPEGGPEAGPEPDGDSLEDGPEGC